MNINGKKTNNNFETITEIIKNHQLNRAAVVVMINGEIIEQHQYHSKIDANAKIEIISFTSGG